MDVVTGAFGYTGKYITRRLLDMGIEVKTFTDIRTGQTLLEEQSGRSLSTSTTRRNWSSSFPAFRRCTTHIGCGSTGAK